MSWNKSETWSRLTETLWLRQCASVLVYIYNQSADLANSYLLLRAQTSTWVTANKWQERLLESVTVSGFGLLSELRTRFYETLTKTLNLVLIQNTMSSNKVHTTHHWHLSNKGMITALFEHFRSWFDCNFLLKLIIVLRLPHNEKQCTTCLVSFKTIYRD